VSITLLCGVGY